MKRSKKILSILLAISLMTAYLPQKAYADEAKEITVHAKENAQKTEVTFDPNMPDNTPAGSKVKGTMKKQTFTYGKSAKLNNAAYKIAGFTFVEWNTVKTPTATEPGRIYENNAAVDTALLDAGETVTLYAQWEPVEYKITYTNAVDGKNGVENKLPLTHYVTDGDIRLTAPSRAGYTFAGWYKDKKFKNELPGDTLDGSAAKNLTVYAKWDAKKATIVYDANKPAAAGTAEMQGSMKDQTVTYKTTKKLKAAAYRLDGYLFMGWNTVKDPTTENPGRSYEDQAAVDTALVDADGTVTLYAQWTPYQHRITYGNAVVGKNDVVQNDNPAGYNTGDGYLELSEPVRLGYTFKGWYTDKDLTKKLAASAVSISGEKDVTVYAKWKAKKTVVTYVFSKPQAMPDGTKVKGTMRKQTITHGKKTKLRNAAYTVAGYTFAGWNTAETPTEETPGRSYANQAVADAALIECGDEVRLYAQWKPKQYKITYAGAVVGRRGVTENSNPSYYTVEMGTIVGEDNGRPGEFVLKAPVRPGCVLTGWYLDSKFRTPLTAYKTSTKKAVTFYAQWEYRDYTIHYDPNLESLRKMGYKGDVQGTMSDQRIGYECSITLLANAYSCPDYTFKGWVTEQDPDKLIANIATVKNLTKESSITLYAVWEANPPTASEEQQEQEEQEEQPFELSAEMQADREIKAAFDMGLLSRELVSDMKKTISYKECAELLYGMLSLHGKAAADGWKEEYKLCFDSDRLMKMDDAVILYYFAARAMGFPFIATAEDYHVFPKDWAAIWRSVTFSDVKAVREVSNSDFGYMMRLFAYYLDEKNGDQGASFDYPCLPGWEEKDDGCWGTLNTAFAFAVSQHSYISNKTLFDFDIKNGTLFGKDLSTEAAIRAAVRLYESCAATADASEIQAARAEADARRAVILSSPTTIEKGSEYVPGKTYSGTAYYVSNDGSDENDGLTPETPFRTVEKVNFLGLQKGDAVFFRRGDIWREGLNFWDGVTYSAYGEGRKPRFYGSAESGAGEEKWTLYHTGPSGEKIWKYYREMPDTGGIIFNDGESYATRAYSWWSVEQKAHICIYDTGKLFVPENELLEDGDLTFCSLVDYGEKQFPIICYEYDKTDRGGLYLRCDKGNPGVLYREIEFENNEVAPGFSSPVSSEFRTKEAVLDNLSVRYWGYVGIFPWATDMVYIQNCEVAWGGNRVLTLSEEKPTTGTWLSGDGIYSGKSGVILTNSYIHDLDGAGVTMETSDHIANEYRITGNLIERCGQGIYLHAGGEQDLNAPLLIDDNMVLDIGTGYVHGCFNSYNAIWVGDFAGYNAPITISNNLVIHALHNPIAGLTGVEILENNRLYH